MWGFLSNLLKKYITKRTDYELERLAKKKKELKDKEHPLEIQRPRTVPLPAEKLVLNEDLERQVDAPYPSTQPITPRTRLQNLPSLKLNDGRGGNLWKDHSESNGNPVVLLASAFPRASQLYLTNEKRNKKIEGYWAGWHNPEETADGPKDRGHYRFKLSDKQIAQRLGKRVILVAKFGNVVRELVIPNVLKRHD